MRVALLTRQGSIYGGMILEKAAQVGLRIDAVILQKWGREQQIQRLKYYTRKYGFFAVLFSKFIEFLDSKFIPLSSPVCCRAVEEALSGDIEQHHTPTLNGAESIEVIERIKPDLLLLGGVGIVSKKILALPGQGVINAHPGFVPQYRGSYVVRWAILAGDPVGITIHFVEAGIDTGKVIAAVPIELPPTRSLVYLESWVDQKRAEQFVWTAQRCIHDNLLPLPPENRQQSHLYSLMPPTLLLKTYGKLWQRS